MLYKKIFTILTLFGFYYCYSQPSWINEKEKYYPISKYLSSVGIGKDFKSAEAQAQQGILSQIKVSVSSTINSTKSEINNEFNESMVNTTSAYVEGSAIGIEFVKSENIDELYYVLAALDKKKYCNSIKTELDDLSNKIEVKSNSIYRYLQNGKLINALKEMETLYLFFDALIPKKLLYDGISDNPYSIALTNDISEIDEQLNIAIGSLSIQIIKGIGQKGLIGSVLPQAVTIFTSYKYKDNELPLVNFSVCIIDESDKILDKGITNDDGNASFYILASPKNGNKGQVKISPYFLHFPNLLINYLKNVETVLTYEVIKESPLELSFYVFDENKNELDDVKKRLSQNITKLGHTIRDGKSGLVLELTVNKVDTKTISGSAGDQYLVKVEGIFTLKITSTNENIGSFTTTSTGLGNKEEQATKSAYQKIQLDKNGLSRIISEGKDAIEQAKDKISIEAFKIAESFFAKDKLNEAINKFSEVSFDKNRVLQAQMKIKEIKQIIRNRYEGQVANEIREKELELEKVKVKSNTQVQIAKIESEKDVQMATIQSKEDITSKQINAELELNRRKMNYQSLKLLLKNN